MTVGMDVCAVVFVSLIMMLLSPCVGSSSSEETDYVTYSATDAGLRDVPCDIPSNTTLLDVGHNRIAIVDQDCLTGLNLTKLLLNNNWLTSFPNLAVVGKTLLVLYLKGNQIPEVTKESLQGLDVLTELNMNWNQLTAFPDLSPIGGTLEVLEVSFNDLGSIQPHLLTNLTALRNLRIRDTGLVEFPDLSNASPTLVQVRFDFNKLASGTISDQAMAGMKTLVHLQLIDIGLTTLPNLEPMCRNVRYINFNSNSLSAVDPDSFIGCVNTVTVEMVDNDLTEFPNVTYMTETLEQLHLGANRIVTFNGDYLQGAVVLTYLALYGNLLTVFPNVSLAGHCLEWLVLYGNNISYISADVLDSLVAINIINLYGNQLSTFPDVPGPSGSLQKLDLGNNHFTTFPHLKNIGGNITTLSLKENDISFISAADLTGLDSIKVLDLDGTGLTTLPDLHAISDTLESLKLRGVPLASVPAGLASYLGPVQSVELGSNVTRLIPSTCPQPGNFISLVDVEHLDLCDCGMLWLKLAAEAGVEVEVVDQNCAGLNDLWSNLTSTELLDVCGQNVIAPGCRKEMLLTTSQPDWYCHFPPGRLLPGITLNACTNECFATPGCQSYNFRPAAGGGGDTGDCVIVAPSGGSNYNNTDSKGWTYHAAWYEATVCPGN